MSIRSTKTAPEMADAVAARYKETRELTGYIPRFEATPETYAALGYKSGLEIHQQLLTSKKLFCRCPAGLYQEGTDFDAELIRHMRPTLSEMGEYDGTALMEKRTRKNIIYRIKDESACTYDIDDTPPFLLNQQAMEQSIEIALLLDCNLVSELHIARKQYLDGSIPTGFQRTGIVGVSGSIPIGKKRVGITQISIEEDSCREVSDVGHWRTYTTDRLGMPLIETVTDPDCLTPDELAEAGQYLRFLVRSTGKVRTGMGAARQDVNASIAGGTRVEIKGVAHITWIPELTHNEAFRQKSLLTIADMLKKRFSNAGEWKIRQTRLDNHLLELLPHRESDHDPMEVHAVALPGFGDIMAFFNQPGLTFADELRGRLKVIACVEHPNLYHDLQVLSPVLADAMGDARSELGATRDDALVLIWAPQDDIATALETIQERCQMAFEGVPNETRKAFANGTTTFERVLPGPDRMYPDTDSAPIPISEELIARLKANLPEPVDVRMKQLREWKVPEDTHAFLLKSNLVPLLEELIETTGLDSRFAGTLLGHTYKCLLGKGFAVDSTRLEGFVEIARNVLERKMHYNILAELLPLWMADTSLDADMLLEKVGYENTTAAAVTGQIEKLKSGFSRNRRTRGRDARAHWVMGRVRRLALGNMPLSRMWQTVKGVVGDE